MKKKRPNDTGAAPGHALGRQSLLLMEDSCADRGNLKHLRFEPSCLLFHGSIFMYFAPSVCLKERSGNPARSHRFGTWSHATVAMKPSAMIGIFGCLNAKPHNFQPRLV